jgi:hypothetical protein
MVYGRFYREYQNIFNPFSVEKKDWYPLLVSSLEKKIRPYRWTHDQGDNVEKEYY